MDLVELLGVDRMVLEAYRQVDTDLDKACVAIALAGPVGKRKADGLHGRRHSLRVAAGVQKGMMIFLDPMDDHS